MNNALITDIRNIVGFVSASDSTEDEFTSLAVKLQSIMALDGTKQRRETVSIIDAFFKESETKKRKLLSFCRDFYDPTARSKTITQNGKEIQLNALLHEDDLYRLVQFVKRHGADNSFGETVYSVMARHNLSASQVYKGCLLRRQDFARVTDPRSKSVTKQMAWQIIIGLHCNLDEADEVLFSAGYIRRNTKLDLTMAYFIKRKNYDIIAINEVLEELKLKLFSYHNGMSDEDRQ